jgi:electron transfer flavoprotein alpha/beta subunit
MGADRVVLVSDDEAANPISSPRAARLAAALEREGADLVLFGQQPTINGAVLWAAVADRVQRR